MAGDDEDNSVAALRAEFRGHMRLDDQRFLELTNALNDIKGYGKALILGVGGTLGIALLNLILTRGGLPHP